MDRLDRLSMYRPFSFELIPKYNFSVDFTSISTILSKTDFSIEVSSSNTLFDVAVKLKGVKLYDFSIEAGTAITLPNSTANYPSKINYNGNISLTFYADTSAISGRIYYAWIESMYYNMKEGLMNPPKDWLAEIPIHIYNRNGKLIQKRIYYDCYPTAISSNDYDKSSTEYQEDITIDLTVTGGLSIEYI